MAGSTVIMQWRRGIAGDQGIYTFNPKPHPTREYPGSRIARLVVPLQDGEVIQNLGQETREVRLQGFLYTKNSTDWDTMETLRNNLINGLGIGLGQLHFITAQRHFYYAGQIEPSGIKFEEQDRASSIHEYSITILIPDSQEINEPLFNTQTLSSGAEIL